MLKNITILITLLALSGCAELRKVVNTDAWREKPHAPIEIDYPVGNIDSAKNIDDTFAALSDKLAFYNPPATVSEQPAAMHRKFGFEGTPGVQYTIIQPYSMDDDGVFPTYAFGEKNLASVHIALNKNGSGTRIKYFFEGKPTRTSENIALFIQRMIIEASQ